MSINWWRRELIRGREDSSFEAVRERDVNQDCDMGKRCDPESERTEVLGWVARGRVSSSEDTQNQTLCP